MLTPNPPSVRVKCSLNVKCTALHSCAKGLSNWFVRLLLKCTALHSFAAKGLSNWFVRLLLKCTALHSFAAKGLSNWFVRLFVEMYSSPFICS